MIKAYLMSIGWRLPKRTKMSKNTGNNGKGNTEERDDWWTPQWLFDKLDEQYGFRLDCCATKENKKCEFYENDFLNRNFNNDENVCWMNPPFSKASDMFAHFFKLIKKGVCIYRCDNMETKIWQDIIMPNATWVFIPKGRISYEGKAGKGSRFPSALIGFNVEEPLDLDGWLLRL